MSDRYTAQQGHGAAHQTCLAHLAGDVAYAVEVSEDPVPWRLRIWLNAVFALSGQVTTLAASTLLQTSCAEAVEKLRWYALRWKIEVFHKILKSGCRAEEARLRTAECLVKLIAVFCILSWRVFWMTMIGRSAPEGNPRLAFTAEERAILDRIVPNKGPPAQTLSSYLTKLARLGGYLARTRDPPPGTLLMWHGLSRLPDIALGATLTLATLKCG